MPMILPIIAVVAADIGAAVTAVAVAAAGATLSITGSAAIAAAVGNFALAAIPAGIELGAMAGVSALLAPRNINNAGSPQLFKANPNAPIPIIMGRYGVGGNLVYETTSGGGNKTEAGAKGNEYLTSFVILSGNGPVELIESLRFNDTILTFDPNGQACNGGYIPYDEVQAWNPGYTHQNSDGSYINNNYQDHAWQNTQLGAMVAPYFSPPSKLASDNAALPEWTSAHGFSSFAASALTLVYDQRYYAGGVPQYQWVVQGHKLYDPRKDSTYPGGNGSHRWAGAGATKAQILAARATWEFSQNPHIHALNYAMGYYYPDAETGLSRLYAGIGAGPGGVVTDAFVRAANVADANGWVICGQWTTGDGKWSVLTAMLGAGGGSPVFDRGLISCIVSTPLTSLGTVTADDLSGAPITLDTGSSMTARINTIFPRFTSEAHRWQMVQADTPVKAQTYVAEDGGVRSKTIDWQYVPAVNQACQLAAYTITDGREITGIVLSGKPKLRNYGVGDCFTVDIPEAGLATTKVMVTSRKTDPMSGGVTLTVRTETDAKHAYSLGLTGVAPATPGISGYDPTIVAAPLPDNWATGVLEISDPITGEVTSVISVVGSSSDDVYAQTVVLRSRPVTVSGSVVTPTGTGTWTYESFASSTGSYQLDLNAGTYDVQIGYVSVNGAYPDPANDADWTDLGVETVGGSTSAATASVPGGSLVGSQQRTMDEVLSDIAGAQAAAAALQTQVDTDTADIAALTATYGDTASAAQSAAAAQAAATAAATAQANTQTALGQAQDALTDAQTAATDALGSAGAAAGSATTATTAAGTATTMAGQASTSSGTAQQAATTATTQAQNAAGSASAASTSATTAATSATTSTQQASAAQLSAQSASTSAGDAQVSASAAATSETNAAGSAQTATAQQQLATQAAGQAGNSATAANGSASTATSQASAAGSSASAANASMLLAQGYAGTASSQATVATGAASSATASASAAGQYASIASSTGIGSLNKSPTFSDYAAATGVPTNWSDWSNGSTGARVAGLASPYAYQLTSDGTIGSGIQQDGLKGFVGGGYYVLEAQIAINAGGPTPSGFNGAGVLLVITDGNGNEVESHGLSFYSDPDNTGNINGAGYGNSQVYSFSKIIQIGGAGPYLGVLYAMSKYNGLPGTIVAETVVHTWYRCDVRPASTMEIQAGQALTIANAASASISSFQTAQTSANSATAQELNTLSAQLSTAASSTLYSIVQNNQAANSSAQSTFASQISTLQSTVGGGINGTTLTASVTATSQTVATLTGQLYGSYTMNVTAGSVITGMQLLSASGATTVSAVIFQAENFLIKSASAANAVSPFAYNSTTGTLSLQNVIVTNAVIGTAAIGTLNLGAGAVTQMIFNLTDWSNGGASSGTPIGPGPGSSAPVTSAPPTSTPTPIGGSGSRGVQP